MARALPTAATVPEKKIFQLGETSSYVEPPKAVEEESPSARAKRLRQEFATPADEISAVASEIKNIFRKVGQETPRVDKSKDQRNPFFVAFAEEKESLADKENKAEGSSPFYASSTLSSTATRGTARLDKAFARRKKTKLAQEKENIAAKSARFTRYVYCAHGMKRTLMLFDSHRPTHLPSTS